MGYTLPRPLSLILLLLALLLPVRPAAAHGEGAVLHLADAPAGPFALSVWSYPGYLMPGSVHFSVSVLEAATGSPLPATAVFIQAVPLGDHHHTSPIQSRAVLEYQTLLHEGYLDIQEPGRYEITVEVAASNEEQGQVTFEIVVESGTGLKVLIILFLGFSGIVGLWLLKEGFETWGINRLIERLVRPSEIDQPTANR